MRRAKRFDGCPYQYVCVTVFVEYCPLDVLTLQEVEGSSVKGRSR